MNEQEFFDLLSKAPPNYADRTAFAAWLDKEGQRKKAQYIRHRAEMFKLTSASRLHQFHASAARQLGDAIDGNWLEHFRTDLSTHDKISLTCSPYWTGAAPSLESNVPRLEIVDGISVYFRADATGMAINNDLLSRWDMPFEYVVSQTVILYHDELGAWSSLADPEHNSIFLYESEEGGWALWLYARPETWRYIEDATDGEVALDGLPLLMAVDENRLLMTSQRDQAGLEQLAYAAAKLLDGGMPVTLRPLRQDSENVWSYLPDDENESARVWSQLFGANTPKPFVDRKLRNHVELIADANEREAARELVTRPQPRHRLEVLQLRGARGDWRLGERHEPIELPEMRSLPHLMDLRIWEAEIPERWWKAFARCQLPSLVSFALEKCEYDGSHLCAVSAFSTIEFLRVCIACDEALSSIAGLPNLGELDLAGTSVTDEGVGRLSGCALQFLDLSDCKITDSSLSTIGTMRSLRGLSLQNTTVTDQGLAQLACLSHLTHLDLRGTQISDESVFSLSQVKSLQSIQGLSGPAQIMLMDELPNFGYRLGER